MVPTFRSTPPLTHAALIARVNTICKRVIAQRNAITSQLHTEEDFAQHIPQFAAYEQAGLAELRSLTPPSSLTATWRRIGAIAATLESETGKWGGLVKEKRVKLAYSQVYPNMVSLDVKITHALRRKGFKDCKEF